jgi:hypothetical protein
MNILGSIDLGVKGHPATEDFSFHLLLMSHRVQTQLDLYVGDATILICEKSDTSH